MIDLDRAYRSAVLGVAGLPPVRRLVTGRGWPVARRFVAGETLADALAAVDRLRHDGVHGILDLLGEMVTSPEQAERFTREILAIFDAVRGRPEPAYVSIKLSQLGLDLPGELGLGNARRVVERAREVGAFVRIDMEDSPRVDRTLEVYRELRSEFDNVGTVVQSSLYRSEADVVALAGLRPNLRIVKGAYLEPPDVAYPDKAAVDMQYRRLVYANLGRGDYTAVATHDESIIRDVRLFAERQGIGRDRFEFQMLYGVRRDLQRSLATEGFTVRAYIPYGRDWYAYFSRRIAERPANVGFVLRGLLRG